MKHIKTINEIWKPIKGYEGLYEVSNFGRVKSLNYNRTGEEKILKFLENKKYLSVSLWKNKKYKQYKVHRLVAITFIPNPDNKPYVNHLDCDPSNNNVNNLEWCTQKENMQYAGKLNRLGEKSVENGKKCSKAIIAVNIQTNEETYFESIRIAAKKLNICHQQIVAILKNKQKTAKKIYTFKYVGE